MKYSYSEEALKEAVKENLQLLCYNCHVLTDNYKGKNPLSAFSERRGVECRKFRETFEGNNINGNPELSLVENEESAESRHGKPKSKKPRKLNAIRKWCKLYGILDMVKGYSRPQTSVQDGSE